MLTNNQTPVEKIFMRREYKTLKAPCELKFFISGANLDNSEQCNIDVHCKAFLKGNSFVLKIIWPFLTKMQITHGYIHQMSIPRTIGEYLPVIIPPLRRRGGILYPCVSVCS